MTALRSGLGDVRSFGTPARCAIRRSMPAAAWATPMSDSRWRIACSCCAAPGSLLRRLPELLQQALARGLVLLALDVGLLLDEGVGDRVGDAAAFLGSSVAVAVT